MIRDCFRFSCDSNPFHLAPLAISQLPDGKLYIASEFLRKPHQLKFFGLFSGVAVG